MLNKPGQVECWMCGELFTPSQEKYDAWVANSDGEFDPEQWQCSKCVEAEDIAEQLYIDRVDAANYEYWSSVEEQIEESGWWQSEDMTDGD